MPRPVGHFQLRTYRSKLLWRVEMTFNRYNAQLCTDAGPSCSRCFTTASHSHMVIYTSQRLKTACMQSTVRHPFIHQTILSSGSICDRQLTSFAVFYLRSNVTLRRLPAYMASGRTGTQQAGSCQHCYKYLRCHRQDNRPSNSLRVYAPIRSRLFPAVPCRTVLPSTSRKRSDPNCSWTALQDAVAESLGADIRQTE
jgi:hypothetical protein